MRTASTPHTAFRLDPSFTSLPSQGRSAPPPVHADPGSASHTLGLAHGFCRLGRAFCAFLAASLLPFASGYEDTGLSPATRAAPRDPAALTGVPLSYPLPVEVRLPEGAASPRCLHFFPSHLSLRFLRCGSSRSTQVTKPQRLPESRDALLSRLTPWGCFLKSHFLLEKSLPHWLVSTLSSISS